MRESAKQFVCKQCNITRLAPKRKSDICAKCSNERRKIQKAKETERKRNFRMYIIEPKTNSVENPTPKKIVQIVAEAYEIPLDRMLSPLHRTDEEVWGRYLSLFLVCQSYPLTRGVRFPEFPNVNPQKAKHICSEVTKFLQDKEILNAVKQIRSRYYFTDEKAMETP